MKIRYEYVNNEVIEVEVDDALGMEIGALETAQARKNRAETRRHASLERLMEGAVQFAADGNIEADADTQIMSAMLRDAIARLPPQHQSLLRLVYIERKTLTEIAREEGVKRAAICRRLTRIHAQIKKVLDET